MKRHPSPKEERPTKIHATQSLVHFADCQISLSHPERLWRIRPTIALTTIKDLDDLLNLAWNYRSDEIDQTTLWKLIPAITELKNMIGMQNLKEDVLDLMLYHLRGLNKRELSLGSAVPVYHTVILGNPGVGKSTVAKILAKIYCGLGFLKTDKVIVAKRTDFIDKWIGHSDAKTEEILKKAKGGVLFFDEAYSLGQKEHTDSFSKAVIDILNQSIGDNPDFAFFIAGYEKEIYDDFLSINPGLESRFTQWFRIDTYKAPELFEMFKRSVKRSGWGFDEGAITEEFFRENLRYFTSYGRDIKTFIDKCKIKNARVLGGKKFIFTERDINTGLESFRSNKSPEVETYKNLYN